MGGYMTAWDRPKQNIIDTIGHALWSKDYLKDTGYCHKEMLQYMSKHNEGARTS